MSMLIKAGEAAKLKPLLSTMNLNDHLEEANAVVGEARQEATRIVSVAQNECAEALEAAKKEGYEAGFQLGLEEGRGKGHGDAFAESAERFRSEQEAVMSVVNDLVEGFERHKRDVKIRAERDVLELAVAIATKLTFEIGDLNREAAKANYLRALALVGARTDLVVRLNPKDAEGFKTFAKEQLECLDSAASVEVVEQDDISPGGCQVSDGVTEVDARLDTQISQVVEMLLQEYEDNDGTV